MEGWRGKSEQSNIFFPNRAQFIKPIGVLERSTVSGQALGDSGLYHIDLQTSVFVDFQSRRSRLLDKREQIQLKAIQLRAYHQYIRASLVTQTVKSIPAVQETQVRSLDWEDPLEEGMATHSSILAWRTPWMEEPGGPQSKGAQRVGHDLVTEQPQACRQIPFCDKLVLVWMFPGS